MPSKLVLVVIPVAMIQIMTTQFATSRHVVIHYRGLRGVPVRQHVLQEVGQEVMDGPVITKMKWLLVNHVMLVPERTLYGLNGVFAPELVQEDIKTEIVTILAGDMIKWEDLINLQIENIVDLKDLGLSGHNIHR